MGESLHAWRREADASLRRSRARRLPRPRPELVPRDARVLMTAVVVVIVLALVFYGAVLIGVVWTR